MKFFEILGAAKHMIYEGCSEGLSLLSAATRMMIINTNFNLIEDFVDAIADFIKEYMSEENLFPASYNEIHKLVSGFGLKLQIIDVFIDNCMIYWKTYASPLDYQLCGKPRFQLTSGIVRISYKRIWYLPFKRTTRSIKWHA